MDIIGSRYLPTPFKTILVSAIAIAGAAFGAEPSAEKAGFPERCLGFYGPGVPLNCFEHVASDQSQNSSASELAGGWRFVRTRHPQGGPDAISIMHTADTSKSDLDLAGLMIRCSDNGAEILVVLIRSFPLRARPKVVFGKPGNETRFETSVVAPGTAILLPKDAATLVNGPWRSLTELFVQVDDEQGSTRGVVALTDLKPAVDVLMTNCLAR